MSTAVWPNEITDVLTYRHAGARLGAGDTGLYDVESLPAGVWPYLYPPAFAAMWAAIAWLPESLGNGIWALAVATGVALGFVALRRLGRLGTGQTVVLGLAMALPVGWLLIMGQVDGFVVALLAIALLADGKDRPVAAGVLIGTAAAIKVIPALVLLPILALRKGRVVLAAVATGLGLSLLPLLWLVPAAGLPGGVERLIALHAEFVRQVVLVGFGQHTAVEWMSLPWNASLPGTALRLFGAPWVGSLVMWGLILAAAWLVHRTRDGRLGVALALTAGALGSFVFSSHNVVLFALPLAVTFSVPAAVLVVASFLLALQVDPALGTAGYLLVWAICAVEGMRQGAEPPARTA